MNPSPETTAARPNPEHDPLVELIRHPDITGQTQLVGVMGWPVSHSISPIMHNAAFAALGLNWRYLPLPVHPDRIEDAVRGLRALGFRGANVTVPHKQAVMPFLDRWEPAAAAIQAVNTIWVTELGELVGDNTDAAGFLADLREQGVDLDSLTTALVLGAGGAARAVVYALAEAGLSRITVLNRTVFRAEALIQGMAAHFPDVTWRVGALPQDVARHAAEADLIVNCTAAGMHPRVEELPWDEEVAFHPHQVVYDLVYTPPATRLLQLATADGARAINGLGMLVHQGAIAFQRWTGEPAPVDVMRRAVQIVLDR